MTITGQLRKHVNETVIQALEQQMVPWRSDHGFPKNILSRRRYGGVEAILLMVAGQRRGFTSCFWGARQEWEALDGRIKEGPGTQIVASTVWNLDQIDGNFPISRNERPTVDYALVERIIANTRADIRFTDERVAEYYYPQDDKDGDFILMCRKEHFLRGPGGAPSFYHALFHELAHMSEVGLDWYGPHDVREWRAELASDFLSTELMIPNYPYQCRRNLHKYLNTWIDRMRHDSRAIFKVARAAAKAVDYILAFTMTVEPRHQAA